MKRLASIMYLKPGQQHEYQKRHDKLWPEMESALKAHGANNYSIFLNEGDNVLFAYLEVPNIDAYHKIATTPICLKWWEYMAPIMRTNQDNSPVSVPLKEVFYLK